MFGLVVTYLKVSYVVALMVSMFAVAAVSLWYLWIEGPPTGYGRRR